MKSVVVASVVLLFFVFDACCHEYVTQNIFARRRSVKQLREALDIRRSFMARSKQQFPCLVNKLLDNQELVSCCEEVPEVSDVNTNTIKPKPTSKFDKYWPDKWPRPTHSEYYYRMVNGIMKVYHDGNDLFPNVVPSIKDFRRDFEKLVNLTMNSGDLTTYVSSRMNMMDSQYDHQEARSWFEQFDQNMRSTKRPSTSDLYSIAKVDNHIHGMSAMTQHLMVDFVRRKFKTDCDKPVYQLRANTRPLTLCQLFALENITYDEINIDRLNLHAISRFTRNRFDFFLGQILKPFGSHRLGRVFLNYDNLINGSYFAEIFKEVISRLDKYNTFAEIRLYVYGSAEDNWSKLAKWYQRYDLLSYERVRWAISIAALSTSGLDTGKIGSYEDVLKNIFNPLFQVTIDSASDPALAKLLNSITLIDNDSGEGDALSPFFDLTVPPHQIKDSSSAPFIYQIFYTYANIAALNNLRSHLGQSLFTHRPHIGETGELDHLIVGFMLGQSVQHGIRLDHQPVLRYLYYLAKIGVAVCPTSNNYLWVDFQYHPFYKFFKLGMFLSINTDNPAQFHASEYPLWEEYTTVQNMWRLSNVDMAELARNSVILSNFPHQVKQKLIGDKYNCMSIDGNNETLTTVSNSRIEFRLKTWTNELKQLSFLEN